MDQIDFPQRGVTEVEVERRGRFATLIGETEIPLIHRAFEGWAKFCLSPDEFQKEFPSAHVWDNLEYLRVVGGAVRDMVLGQHPKDIDLCTELRPEQMIRALDWFQLNRSGMYCKVIPTGLQHGTITVRFPETRRQFEITTLRQDTVTDGRHAEVDFVLSFYEDAKRRDFTMNAMSVDMDYKLRDYFGGYDDARLGIVRFVGNPMERVKEDYLRVMRFYRFSARFKQIVLDRATAEALVHGTDNLDKISGERIWSELSRTLMTPGCEYVVQQMMTRDFYNHALGLHSVELNRMCFESLLEDAQENKVPAIAMLFEIMHLCIDRFDRAYYYDDHARLIETVNARLKFSVDERKLFEFLWTANKLDKFNGPRRLVQIQRAIMREDINYAHGRVWMALNGGYREEGSTEPNDYEKFRAWTYSAFPLGGQDMIELGFVGKAIGEELRRLRILWADSDGEMIREELLLQVNPPRKKVADA